MNLYVNILLIFLTLVSFGVSYFFANKKHNKKIMIIGYISLAFFVILLVYLALTLILVGGIK